MQRDVFKKAIAKKAALRWKHPSRNVRLILIAGDYGARTTALYLSKLLHESGQKTAVFAEAVSHINGEPYAATYDSSADSIQRAIAKSRKEVDAVLMVVTPEFLHTASLQNLQCELALVTSDGELAQSLLETPSAFIVLPDQIDRSGLDVAPHRIISYGDTDSAETQIKGVTLYRGGTEVDLKIDHQTHLKLSTYLLGRANAYNVAAAVAAGYLLGLDITQFEEGIAGLEHVPANLELIKLDTPYAVYVDAAPSSVSADLVSSSMKQITKRRLLIACDESFSEDTLELLGSRADRVTVVKGQEINGRYHADSNKQAVEHTLRSAKKDDIVLLLGPQFAANLDGRSIGETLTREVLNL